MNLSQHTKSSTAGTSRILAVSRKAALSVAAAAAIGGAVFAPATQAMAATPTNSGPSHAIPAGCGECYPDVM